MEASNKNWDFFQIFRLRSLGVKDCNNKYPRFGPTLRILRLRALYTNNKYITQQKKKLIISIELPGVQTGNT